MTEPTEQDHRNFALRKAIADRQRAEYEAAEAQAVALFGEGWVPHGKHSLVTHAEADRARREGGRDVAAASVVTARNAANEARHFMIVDGVAREVASWEAGFGAMLTEPDLERTIEVRGQLVHPHLYELHWSGFEADYTPKSAEELAAARAKREDKDEKRWQAEVNQLASQSLFPEWVREQAEEQRKKGRKR